MLDEEGDGAIDGGGIVDGGLHGLGGVLDHVRRRHNRQVLRRHPVLLFIH